MKILFYLIITLFISCQNNDFVKGDCIQKPDEIRIWKIVSINESNLTVVESAPHAPEIVKEFSLSGNWIKTSCKN